MEIEIHRYRPEDAEVTADIFRRAILEVSIRDYTPAEAQAWADVMQDRAAWATRRASRPTWIAVVAGRAAGFSDLTKDGLLDMMFVHPDFQRIGVASALLAVVEAEAIRQGHARIHTEASRTSQPFFARRGFRVLSQGSAGVRGETLENYRMEKALPRS